MHDRADVTVGYTHISNWPKFESILSSSKKDIDDHILSGQFQVISVTHENDNIFDGSKKFLYSVKKKGRGTKGHHVHIPPVCPVCVMTICINFVEIILPKTFSGDTDYRAENVFASLISKRLILYTVALVWLLLACQVAPALNNIQYISNTAFVSYKTTFCMQEITELSIPKLIFVCSYQMT